MGLYGTGTYGVKTVGSYAAVYGQSDEYGVVGYGENNTGGYLSGGLYGLQAYTANGTAIYSQSNSGRGVDAHSDNYIGGYFYSTNNNALWAKTGRSDKNWAGVFEGNVFTFNAYQTSDENLKKNIEEVSSAMNVLMQLRPKSYEFRNDGKLSNLGLPTGKHYGVLAQDLEAVLPNLVKEVENEVSPHAVTNTLLAQGKEQKEILKTTTPERPETIKIKAVNYTELIPIIIKGIQEQQAVIEDQKEKIADLEARIKRLETLITTRDK